MPDANAALDTALEEVIAAARRHLEAVKAAEGRVDDDEVWQSYVMLNNLSFAYDELLMDTFGEVTPWDVDPIDPQEADAEYGVGVGGVDGAEPTDEHPVTISVRQRRDYLVASVAALQRVAQAARRAMPPGTAMPEPGTDGDEAADAVTELLAAGDGSLASLDIPELEPLAGVTVLCRTGKPLDAKAMSETELSELPSPFTLHESDGTARMIVERPYTDDEPEQGEQPQDPAT